MKKEKNVKKIVAEKILANLDNFEGIWSKPWFSSVYNPVSKNHYSGCNVFILGMLGRSGLFATYKQVTSEGGQVNKGAKALPVVFYNTIKSKTEVDKKGEPKTFSMMRYYSVFDLDDCTEVDHLKKVTKKEYQPIADAEKLVSETGAVIEINSITSNSCFYSPMKDKIGMMNMVKFETLEKYYSTLFHELTHWTGHSSRLDRFESGNHVFASNEYSFEELVAELGACMLSQRFGILDSTADNSKAYLKSWFTRLKEKPEDLLNALSKSWKAYQFITKEGKKAK